jgi:GNAT superfamily N-acetyltransferase
MDVRVRAMTGNDMERVGQIFFDAFSTVSKMHNIPARVRDGQEGTSWIWAMSRHQPVDILVAEVDRRVVGCASLNPRGIIAGCGPCVIDPFLKNKGISGRFLDVILERAKDVHGVNTVRCFQEAFNPVSFGSLYFHAFTPVAHLLDLVREAGPSPDLEPEKNVELLEKGDIEELWKYDLPRSRSDRRADLEYYLRWGKVFSHRNNSKIRGYLACLPGSSSIQLGPMVAEGEEDAIGLYQQALAFFKEKSFRTIIMAQNGLLARRLVKLGFRIYCLSNLMVHGDWRPGGYVESMSIFPEGI